MNSPMLQPAGVFASEDDQLCSRAVTLRWPMKRIEPVTIEGVASRAGVSPGTVSRVLNGKNKENRPAIARREASESGILRWKWVIGPTPPHAR